MSWRYRMIRVNDEEMDEFVIGEVYTREVGPDEGKPYACNADGHTPVGETIEELREDMRLMLMAFDDPVFEMPNGWKGESGDMNKAPSAH